MRLYEATDDSTFMPVDALSGTKNTLTVDKQKYTVDGHAKEEYKKLYGKLWYEEVKALMDSPQYEWLSDEDKAKKIKDLVTQAKKDAAEETVSRLK